MKLPPLPEQPGRRRQTPRSQQRQEAIAKHFRQFIFVVIAALISAVTFTHCQRDATAEPIEAHP